jgi:2-hydroxy-3-oxopropionate reductase
MRVGFIGLGVMGRPMARHVLEGGHELGVWARRAAATDPLVASGATAYETPAALAAHSDVVVTMVTGTRDVEEVVLGEKGVIDGARPGHVVVDMSTISAAATRRMAAALAGRAVQMLDAPVTGGPAGAEAATLTIMVGGDPAVVKQVEPVLTCLGRLVHMGGNGAGQTAKACNQLAILVTAEGVAEALTLGVRCGLNPVTLRQALLGGLASSRVLDVFGARMTTREFDSGIETRLYHKDLHTVLDMAHDARQPVPAASLVMRHIDTLMSEQAGRKDLSVLIEVVERLSDS